jgi:hypothetical protein
LSDQDPHLLGPDLLPTPFTADEIRRGCPPGRTIRLRVETIGAEPFIRINRFVDCDADGASIENTRLDAAGEPIGPTEARRSTWHQLQAHAAFARDLTTMSEERLELPIGALECVQYEVVEGSSITTFWFAKSVPGMPVKVESREDGRLTSTVTMIADEIEPVS